MANPEHVEKLNQGTWAWNEWREDHPEIAVDLTNIKLGSEDFRKALLNEVNLKGANLICTNLFEANLERSNIESGSLINVSLIHAYIKEANLSRATLIRTNLRSANLRQACLNGSTLYGTDFSWADLSGADFSNAILRGVNFSKTNLSNTNFSEAELRSINFDGSYLSGSIFKSSEMSDNIFANVDLSNVLNIETIRHFGPSTVGIDTLHLSSGSIPSKFLRGIGTPELFIEQNEELIGVPLEYYSCFLSYSTTDVEFADKIYSDLQINGVRCWYAKEHMRAGIKIIPQIDEAIRRHDKLVLILSENSINSHWVRTEMKRTIEYQEEEGSQRLFPISLLPFKELRNWELIDTYTGRDLAAEVCSYFIPDFSKWKDHYSYRIAFDRLLSDLKATE